MSFDELSTSSTPPQSEEAASNPAQETSGQDAPPASVARRRRARTAGTAAASTPELPEQPSEKPARAPRSRRKIDSSPTEQPGAASSIPQAELQLDDSATPTVAPPRRRTRRGASHPEVAAPDAVAPSAAELLPDTGAAPPRATGRGRRAPRQAPIDTVPEIPSDPGAEPTLPAGRTGRNRSRRVVAAEPPEPQAAEASADEATVAPAQRRRRAGSRTSRVAGSRPDAPEAYGEPVLSPGPDQPAPRPRRRRSRRSALHDDLLDDRVIEVAYPKVDTSVGAHLVSTNGIPEITINGVVHPPVLFFGNIEVDANRDKVAGEIRRAASAGVHLHSTLVELPCPALETCPAFETAADRLRLLLSADPEGYVIPRVVFVPARGWKRDNPTEVSTYADGSFGDPSIASDRYWMLAEQSLTHLVNYLRAQEWGERIVGYHLERGEWFQPASLGYDRCNANRDAFRDWLKHKYSGNVVLMRAAWYDGEVQFATAEIPPMPAKANMQRAFYEPRRERAIIDFHEFTSEITARRLASLAMAAKKAADFRALVSVCYGYTFEFGHTFSGHLALGILESSPAVDLLCGPPSYRDRNPGGAASVPAAIDSPSLHGKMWLSEDDTKTFLASPQQDPEDFNVRLDTREATHSAQQRAMGRTVSHGTGISFMDLWGEGWLDDDRMWEQLAAFVSGYSDHRRTRQQPRIPEVVALIDEKSLLHVQRGDPFLRKLTAGARDSLQRAGVSFGIYLQSDIVCDSFPLEAKLYLFLTPYRLTPEQRTAIKDKLHRDNKTLAWLYAPGSCEERPTVGGALEETATGAIGIALRQQEWNSEVGSRIIDTHHALTDRLLGRDIGVKERLNPSFYVDDPDASVVAEYHGSGLSSIAVKNCDTWRSVFVGDPVLPLDLLRGICRYAGVHVWTPQGEDPIDIGSGFVTIHAAREGQRAIRLPDRTGLYDITESRHIADEIREHRFYMHAGDTRVFCVGTVERFIAMGLPNVAPPGPGRPRIVVTHDGDREPRRDHPAPRASNSDLETLEAVLSMDISDMQGVEADGEEPIDFIYPTIPNVPGAEPVEAAGEVIAGGRRRRRRGGRGRGRRRAGDAYDSGAPTSGGETGATPDGAPGPAEFADTRNSSAHDFVFASEPEQREEHPHAGSDTERDTSL